MWSLVGFGPTRTSARSLCGSGGRSRPRPRAEAGCLSYRLYEDTEIENDFVFVEEWESSEALERHFATAHVGEFMAAIPATIVAPPEVKFHTIASSMDLADVSAG